MVREKRKNFAPSRAESASDVSADHPVLPSVATLTRHSDPRVTQSVSNRLERKKTGILIAHGVLHQISNVLELTTDDVVVPGDGVSFARVAAVVISAERLDRRPRAHLAG